MSFKSFLIAGVCLASLTQAAAAQESQTLKKIRETGIITLGFREASMPFSYFDDKQRPVGYSIDLCARIVDAVKEKLNMPNLEVKFSPITSATRIPLLTNDIIDLDCGTTTNTRERQKMVAFTVTTFVASSSMVSKKSQDIRSVDDLRNQPVVSVAGTTHLKILVDINRKRELDMLIIAGRDNVESFQMIESDRAAAFVMDDVLLHALVASTKTPGDFRISHTGLSIEPYGIGLRKTDPEFKKIADDAIIKVFKSGEIHSLYQRWFQMPIPPKQINLKLPMSAALKKVTAQPIDSSSAADYR